jgi:hypothetical protein
VGDIAPCGRTPAARVTRWKPGSQPSSSGISIVAGQRQPAESASGGGSTNRPGTSAASQRRARVAPHRSTTTSKRSLRVDTCNVTVSPTR